jgi:hypothetical protein
MFPSFRSSAAFVSGCVLTLSIAAYADDTAMSGIGGNVQPLRSHSSVRMVSEEVRIDDPEDPRVRASFVFRNEGPATDVLMGFPEMAGGASGYSYYATLTGFRSWIDGVPVTVTRRRAGPARRSCWPPPETNRGCGH